MVEKKLGKWKPLRISNSGTVDEDANFPYRILNATVIITKKEPGEAGRRMAETDKLSSSSSSWSSSSSVEDGEEPFTLGESTRVLGESAIDVVTARSNRSLMGLERPPIPRSEHVFLGFTSGYEPQTHIIPEDDEIADLTDITYNLYPRWDPRIDEKSKPEFESLQRIFALSHEIPGR